MAATSLVICAALIEVVVVQMGYSPPDEKTEPWISDVTQLREALYAAKGDDDRPTIWIVAGSNALYGTVSSVIEGVTGYRVRNYALHAGLHPDLLFSQIRGKVRAGDLVVAPLEWENYNRPLGNQFDYSNYLHHFSGSVNPDLWTLYRIYSSVPLARWVDGVVYRFLDPEAESYFDGPDGDVLRARWATAQGNTAAYTFEALTPDGDINLPPTGKPWTSTASFTVPDRLTDEGISNLARWESYFTGRGAAFALVPPVMLEGNNDRLVTPDLWGRIERIRAQLSASSTPLQCDPLKAVMASEYRLDSIYHLNAAGAELRSRNLADCLGVIIHDGSALTLPIDPETEALAAAAIIARQESAATLTP